MRDKLILTGVLAFFIGVAFGLAMAPTHVSTIAGQKAEKHTEIAEKPPTAQGQFLPASLGVFREALIREIDLKGQRPRSEEHEKNGWQQTVLHFDGTKAQIHMNGPSGFAPLVCVAFIGDLDARSQPLLIALLNSLFPNKPDLDEKLALATTNVGIGLDFSIDVGYRMTVGSRSGMHLVSFRASDEQADAVLQLQLAR